MKNNKWYKWEVLMLLWVAYLLNQGAEPLLPGIELLVVDDYGNATLKGLQASFEK